MLSLRRRAVTVTVPRLVSASALFAFLAFGFPCPAVAAALADVPAAASVDALSAAHAGDTRTPPASTPPSATTSVFLLNIDFAILIQLLFDCARDRAPIFVRERCA